MREALVKGNKLALGGPVLALREDRDGAADLQAPVDMLVEPPVAVAAPHHRHVAAAVPDDKPLELASNEQRRVREKVQAWLDWEQQQEQELVGPVQVVGDDDVVGAPFLGDVFGSLDLDAKREPHDRHGKEPHDAIRDARFWTNVKKVGGRKR